MATCSTSLFLVAKKSLKIANLEVEHSNVSSRHAERIQLIQRCRFFHLWRLSSVSSVSPEREAAGGLLQTLHISPVHQRRAEQISHSLPDQFCSPCFTSHDQDWMRVCFIELVKQRIVFWYLPACNFVARFKDPKKAILNSFRLFALLL